MEQEVRLGSFVQYGFFLSVLHKNPFADEGDLVRYRVA